MCVLHLRQCFCHNGTSCDPCRCPVRAARLRSVWFHLEIPSPHCCKRRITELGYVSLLRGTDRRPSWRAAIDVCMPQTVGQIVERTRGLIIDVSRPTDVSMPQAVGKFVECTRSLILDVSMQIDVSMPSLIKQVSGEFGDVLPETLRCAMGYSSRS